MDLIAHYRSLIDADLEGHRSRIAGFQQSCIDAQCQYANRPFVKVMRPKFLYESEYRNLEYVSSVLMGVFRRICDMVYHRKDLQEYVGMTEPELNLLRPEPLCPDPCAFTRLDSFQTANGPRFVELNGECPAGAGFSDRAMECFLKLPLLQQFMAETGVRPLPTRGGVLSGLLKVWAAVGRTKRPQILITDYQDIATVHEFHILAEWFRSHGYPTIVEDPRNLTFQNGRLIAQGTPIDLVYRRVLTNEFLEREADVQALWRAYETQSIVMVNPFRAKPAHKKTCFALLSGDYLGQDWLTGEERGVIRRTIPWTRKVREGNTTYCDREVDLLPFVLDNKDRFVLKPSDEYGGRGVIIGWETDTAAFGQLLAEALKTPHVVQERIPTTPEPFPHLEQGLDDQMMIVDLDPYIYLGQVQGVLARLAAGSLCNVTSGGGQVPVFLAPDPA
jgi:hypothetical protein